MTEVGVRGGDAARCTLEACCGTALEDCGFCVSCISTLGPTSLRKGFTKACSSLTRVIRRGFKVELCCSDGFTPSRGD